MIGGRRVHGFTLIELLIVVTILAILCALLFPVFSAAREKARQSVCATHLRQLGQAVSMYSQDYDGILPLGLVPTAQGGRWQIGTPIVFPVPQPMGWWDLVWPYVKNEGLYYCPSEQVRLPGYGMNYYVSGRGEDEVEDSSARILLTEGRVPHAPNETMGPMLDPNSLWIAYRHSDGLNFLFLDGHVTWVHGSRANERQWWRQ